MKSKLFKNKINIIGFLCIIAALAILMIFLDKYIMNMLDSDLSSELILAKLLNSEKGILTSNWFYSTEVRVLNTQLVFAPLFSLFESWKTVRLAGTAILLVILVLSCMYLGRKLKIKNYSIFALLVLCPLSLEYFLFVVLGVYYVPHITITFLSLGMYLGLMDFKWNEWLKKPIFYILLLLSFTAGLGGLRQLVILYLPLFIATFFIYFHNLEGNTNELTISSILNDGKDLVLATIMMISAGMGYVANMLVLTRFLNFDHYTSLQFTGFDMDKLEAVLNGWLTMWGYQSSGSIFSINLILNGIFALLTFSVIFTVISMFKSKEKFSNKEKLIITFSVMAAITLTLVFLFSDLFYVDRYLIPVSILFIPIIAISVNKINNKYIYNSIIFILVASSFVVSLLFYRQQKFDRTGEMDDIAAVLVDEGYFNGYATFWNANVLTELSNGQVSVWCYANDDRKLNLSDSFQWLQLTDHLDNKPDGKVFALFSVSQLANNSGFDEADILYRSDSYTLYGFENYEQLQLEISALN